MRRIAQGPAPQRTGSDGSFQPAARPITGACALGVGLLALVTIWAMVEPTPDRGIAAGGMTPVALAALVSLGGGAVLLVRGVDCRIQRLFRTRRLLLIGTVLTASGVGLTVACLSSGPFASLLARGRADAADVYDACMLAAAFVCLTGAGVAFAFAREARQHERHWLDVLRR